MHAFLQSLGALPAAALAALAAVAGAAGAITAAFISSVVTKFIVTPFLSARDQLDRESEWRRHALELTKLDLERKLKAQESKAQASGGTTPLRPSILDFLANYRDLQELGKRKKFFSRSKPVTPGELYMKIKAQRIIPAPALPAKPPQTEAQGKKPGE
jgi:hypothetical protein